jgi:hypothetical protein
VASAIASTVASVASSVASAVSNVVNAISSAVSNVVNAITGSGEKAEKVETPSLPIPPPDRKEGETEQADTGPIDFDKNLNPPNDDDNDPPTGPEDIIKLALQQSGLIPRIPTPAIP